jgi:DNA-binding CsgD family transcriptional regulator
MPHSTRTWSTKPSPTRAGSVARCADWAWKRIATHPRAKAGWGSLTDSELKVVNLIAQGATNRDVAEQLHLSLHTVKTHVHNAFAKLGIHSRAQLTRLMRGSD